jgi:hypothetical protein
LKTVSVERENKALTDGPVANSRSLSVSSEAISPVLPEDTADTAFEVLLYKKNPTLMLYHVEVTHEANKTVNDALCEAVQHFTKVVLPSQHMHKCDFIYAHRKKYGIPCADFHKTHKCSTVLCADLLH